MGRLFFVFLSMVCSMVHREDLLCSYMSGDAAMVPKLLRFD